MKSFLMFVDLMLSGVLALSCFQGLYRNGVFGIFDVASHPQRVGFASAFLMLMVILRLRKLVAAHRLIGQWVHKYTSFELESTLKKPQGNGVGGLHEG